MTDRTQKQHEFIELRAKGNSFSIIAQKLGVSKSTLINWSKELTDEITNAKSLENDALLDKFQLMRHHQLKTLGDQLHKIRTEVAKRDLSEVPTDKLIMLELKLLETVNNNAWVQFRGEAPFFDGLSPKITWES